MEVLIHIFLQKFLLNGRFIFGPDVRSLVLTIFLIVAPVVIFCIFVARKLMDDSSYWGIKVIVVVVLFTIYVSLSSFLSPPHTILRILFLSLAVGKFQHVKHILWYGCIHAYTSKFVKCRI